MMTAEYSTKRKDMSRLTYKDSRKKSPHRYEYFQKIVEANRWGKMNKETSMKRLKVHVTTHKECNSHAAVIKGSETTRNSERQIVARKRFNENVKNRKVTSDG
ncbi:hypothetical protein, unlikely [Trypanosoma brucei gambiense DAL972]|uniref:Uncharacterized protein n=1 Tax=Trypanosoma brucei gambiense (strain MHOM/CI/86/DAL972) TaxID=679716 RepID=C9ZUN3_TRYB9|nr:hypothetical protein, unlikely [Trypanosoma brucei gambiense DAL972]CBH13121.1 hypothetical protein, unlikely [Trypanosoma brucei gambiense DAL972]|eukprot:XP_011775398.1 hypothetical protein, unlikely [Trypanosoma brucei gambiense DAL972]